MTATDRFFRALCWVVALAVVVFMVLPLVITVLVSFSSSQVYTLPPPEWSFRWYQALTRRAGLREALTLSLNLALISTAISLVLGTAAAIGVARGQFRGRAAIATFAVSPLMMPGLVRVLAAITGTSSPAAPSRAFTTI